MYLTYVTQTRKKQMLSFYSVYDVNYARYTHPVDSDDSRERNLSKYDDIMNILFSWINFSFFLTAVHRLVSFLLLVVVLVGEW